jgi:UDP-glucose 4-epimerase
MQILITGGRGYLGGRIAKNFLDLGHSVSITTRHVVKKGLLDDPINVLSPDWNSSSQLSKACEGVDIVIHAAGMNADDCLRNPELAIEFNGNATKRLAVAAVHSGVKKFIYLSTAQVYSDSFDTFFNEDSPTRNDHPYATSHLLGEKHVLTSEGQHNMQRNILRLSNVYGTPADRNTNCWNLVVNDMARQVAEFGRINLKTNGQQKRDFVSMSDLLNFISGISQESLASTYPQLINFGSGISMTLLEMANLISEISLSVFSFTPPIQVGGKDIPTEDIPFIYSSKYDSLIEKFRKNDMRQEIYKLLIYCKLNFPEVK